MTETEPRHWAQGAGCWEQNPCKQLHTLPSGLSSISMYFLLFIFAMHFVAGKKLHNSFVHHGQLSLFSLIISQLFSSNGCQWQAKKLKSAYNKLMKLTRNLFLDSWYKIKYPTVSQHESHATYSFLSSQPGAITWVRIAWIAYICDKILKKWMNKCRWNFSCDVVCRYVQNFSSVAV